MSARAPDAVDVALQRLCPSCGALRVTPRMFCAQCAYPCRVCRRARVPDWRAACAGCRAGYCPYCRHFGNHREGCRETRTCTVCHSTVLSGPAKVCDGCKARRCPVCGTYDGTHPRGPHRTGRLPLYLVSATEVEAALVGAYDDALRVARGICGRDSAHDVVQRTAANVWRLRDFLVGPIDRYFLRAVKINAIREVDDVKRRPAVMDPYMIDAIDWSRGLGEKGREKGWRVPPQLASLIEELHKALRMKDRPAWLVGVDPDVLIELDAHWHQAERGRRVPAAAGS
jgi:hypothetical protein